MSRTGATDVALVGDIKEALADVRNAVASIATKQRIEHTAANRSQELRELTAQLGREATPRRARNRPHADASARSRRHYGAHNRPRCDVVSVISPGNTKRFPSVIVGAETSRCGSAIRGEPRLGNRRRGGCETRGARPTGRVSIGDGSVMYSASGFSTQARYHIPLCAHGQMKQSLDYPTRAFRLRCIQRPHGRDRPLLRHVSRRPRY